jgi:hypothetical protein
MLLQAVILAGLTWSGHIAVWHLVVLAVVPASPTHSTRRCVNRCGCWSRIADLNAIALNSFLVSAAVGRDRRVIARSGSESVASR